VGVFIFSALARVATAHYYLIYHPQEEVASVAKRQPIYRLQQPPADSDHHQFAYIENYIGNLTGKVTTPTRNT